MLGVFEVSAYHFYKLIEVAIKVETSLPRSIVKHLNRVSTGLSCDICVTLCLRHRMCVRDMYVL